MDTAQLMAFLGVAESGSFSQAANRLHLTQPAISKRIAQLEGQLGVRLFDRIGRQVSTTEAGRTLLPRARRILQDMQDAERALRDADGVVAGTLTLATSHHIGLHRLPPVLRRFGTAHDRVRFDIDFMDSEDALDAVLHGRAELGIITLPPEGIPEKLLARPIWPDPLTVMVARDHPLGHYRRVGLHELAKFDAVLPGSGTYTGQILRRLFDTHGVALQVSMSTNYLETLRMLVSIGLGWSLLPNTMLDEGVHALTLNEAKLQRELGVIYHRDRWLSRAARAFIELLNDATDT